uniref:Orf314 n=1 Tax=Haliclystus sanjuanensis TaxID=168739 RepID=G9ISQ5_9CNID|nr:orf314 [Haliclystus sanjuanensis]
MRIKPFFQFSLNDISTLSEFSTKWKNCFRPDPHPIPLGPFFIYLKLPGNKEIHLADLQQHPYLLNREGIKHVYAHWQAYQAYYSPLHPEALIFYV